MSRFNLIDEKWIPVRFPDGTRQELGISEVLLRSREIVEIEDPSPLVVAALHRFLLAVLYRALEGPTDIDQAKALFKNGLPGNTITAYLERWRNRFWLFDGKYPFYQVPNYEPKEEKGTKQWKPWSAIAAEHNAKNSKVLFDHVNHTDAGFVSSGMAVRWLIACQTFALAGGDSDFKYNKQGPSATAVMVLPLGLTLHDTLILSLVPEQREVFQADLPLWEREPESLVSLQEGKERAITGLVDLYTWRSRSIKFQLRGEGETIGGLAIASGVGCSSEQIVDPMLSYRIDEKWGRLPIRFRDRGLWRDFDALLPDQSHLAPGVIQHATALTRSNRLRLPRSVIVLGQKNDQAKVEYWRMERFTLPEALLASHSSRSEIRQLLTEAERAETELDRSLRTAARLVIARGERDLQKDKWSAGRWIPGDASKFIGKSTFEMVPPVTASYWSSLESRFHDILREYTLARDSDDIRCLWLNAVRDALNAAWAQHRAATSMGDAWAIRALVKAEGPVLRKLKTLSDEIAKLAPQKEVA
jgi:CRISPR system Cascade subunit CasA